MKVVLSRADRMIPPPDETGGKAGWVHLLVYGFIAPVSVVACLASGWYVVTGETPLDVFSDLSGSPRVILPMPPPIGPERTDSALLRPPPTDASGAKAPQAPGAAPTQPADVAPPAVAPQTSSTPPAPEKKDTASTKTASSVAPVMSPPPPMSEPVIPPGGEPLAPPSFSQLPARAELKPLPPAPLPELLHPSPVGALPVIANGKQPYTAYAHPFAGDAGLPHVAIVVVGLGLSRDATEAAIAKLPSEISLSFSPYASNLDSWVKKARGHGHEVLLDLPLEPPNFPLRDAGPLAVLSRQTPTQAQDQLLSILGKANSYVGLAGALRSPVTATEQWAPLLRAIKSRGLLFVGDGLVGVPPKDVPAAAAVSLVADETPFRAAIDARLARVQAAAQRDGGAIVYVSARPVSFERLLAWIGGFPQKGLVLAPVSALVSSPG